MKFIATFNVKIFSPDFGYYKTIKKVLVTTRNPVRVEKLLKRPGFLYKLEKKLKENNFFEIEFLSLEEIDINFLWGY